MRWSRRPEIWVFFLLLGSYAYFWQARDWNSASRLMMTYAIVDRGTVSIDGLEDHTHDRARFRGHFYSDKLPGFSVLAALPYVLTRQVLRLPAHPLNIRGAGFPYWPSDYWVTLGTSGLLTALTGVILVRLAKNQGCGPEGSALIALSYGLATPAYAYATMSYGHQACAFALIGSFWLLQDPEKPRAAIRAGLAGFLAAYAATIELQVGLVSAILGLYLLAQAIGRRRKISTVGDFAVSAALPTLLLLVYNQLAFGSPWEMGYFHLTTARFARVHGASNPLGLNRPNLDLLPKLLWGKKRGLLVYAPIVSLVPLGLFALARRRAWGILIVSTAAMSAVFAVNLSYPEWTGGWTTGPRLLLPLLPFAMIPVSALLARGGRWTFVAALMLTICGGILMLLFVGVGGRVAQDIEDPLREFVWPGWRSGSLTRNLAGVLAPGAIRKLTPGWRWAQFAPLILAQGVAIALMARSIRETRAVVESTLEDCGPGVSKVP